MRRLWTARTSAFALAVALAGCASAPPAPPVLTPLELALYADAGKHVGEAVVVRGRVSFGDHGVYLFPPRPGEGCIDLVDRDEVGFWRLDHYRDEMVVVHGLVEPSNTGGFRLGECHAFDLRVQRIESWPAG